MNLPISLYSLYQITEPFLLSLFFLASAIQIFYYLFFYARVFFFKQNSNTNFNQPISLIIAAHNEAQNLKEFLPFILEQDYPNFELIVIDDRSDDETQLVISNFQKKYKNLRTTFIKNNGRLKHGKKLAITLGIKAAKYDYILLTDADCKPSSNQWIKETVQQFDSSDIILGYGPYFQEDGLLNRLIRYDTMFIALQYMSFARAGFPYMGIGRNLAYKKSLFIKNKGLASHAHLASGDDDLFINEVANKNNVSLSCNSNSFVYSIPKKTFKYWIRQKQRHFSTFKRYQTKHLILLSGELFSRVLFYVLFLTLWYSNINNLYFWIVAIVRLLILYLVLIKASRFFHERKLSFHLIMLDFIFPLLNFFIYLEQQLYKTKKW